MERYRWDVVGITAIRYASSGDLTTLEIISFVLLQKLFTKKKSIKSNLKDSPFQAE